MHRPGLPPRRPTRLRRAGLQVARLAFLVLVVAFAWWGLHGSGDELRTGLAATSLPGVVASAGLVLAGLLATGTAWLKLLAGFGQPLPRREGWAVFFVGQLGKYIPGSVWSVSAHVELARRHGVPLRSTVGTSLVFLAVNMATAGLVGGSVALSGRWHTSLPPGVLLAGLVTCLLAFVPRLVNRAGSLVAGAGQALALTRTDLAALVGLMILTWGCYAAALLALAPATGVGTATALALLTRALHTGGDLVLALASWAIVRFGRGARGIATRRAPGLHESTVGGG